MEGIATLSEKHTGGQRKDGQRSVGWANLRTFWKNCVKLPVETLLADAERRL